MGLGQSSNKTYLSVADGKIIQRVKEGTPGAEARQKTKGDLGMVYEMKFSNISGYLTNIAVVQKELGGIKSKDWVLDIEDGGITYSLQLMYSGGYSVSLLKALCNPIVDFTQPITITPWMKVVNDKKKTACYLKQGEEDVKWYFTKDEPNGMPPLEQVEFRGEKKWDDFKMMNFLEAFINSNVKPKLSKTGSGLQPNTNFDNGKTPEYAPPADLSYAPDEDDLPFS
jgi:hypothetical protein